MRWRGVFSECLLTMAVLGLAATTPASAIAYTKPSFDEDDCEEVLACHKCSADEKEEVRECAVSGKIQTLNCILDPERDDEMNTVTRYMTCDRTQDDEQSRFVHFQVLCLVLGVLSFAWVRRYRVVYASLFEQRKLSMVPNSSRRPSDTGGSIEMATREEISPLNSNGLDVV
mmetsp:Transcript_9076/g.17303  ORF Transcript_9076/g.17303 Transcript_9076/m.17303 type:complete len:172 (+) Transcript_9076:171-686(+)